MLKIAWLSDLHFVATGTVSGHDPRVRLSAAIDLINQHHGDCEFCVISGDLVNEELTDNYQALHLQLASLNIPYLPMMGNHDDRGMLRSVLPLPENCMSDFIQYAVNTPQALILCLDTHKRGAAAGEFCDARSRWLEQQLAMAEEKPVIVFMHHPPMQLGLSLFDEIMLEHGDKLIGLINQFSGVKQLFLGHVHRPITGVATGIPFATMRSLAFQAPPPEPEWDWSTFTAAPEAPSMGIVSVSSDGDITLQYLQVCGHQVGATF